MTPTFSFIRLNELYAPPPVWAQKLRECLAQRGYNEENMCTFQVPIADPQQSLVALLYECERSDEPFALLARIWLMSQKVKRSELQDLMGEQLVEFLIDWGILVELDEQLAGSVDIHSCMGGYFLTDRAIGLQRELQSVYHLGGDSYALAWMAPRLPFQKGLDLATGSGVHAVLAAEHTDEIHAVDISQRAIDFATFNAICNGARDKIKFFLGDIYQALPEGKYDLVLSNLPWVPTPDEPMELYRSGGLDGEVLIRRMVQGLRDRLAVGGWMASYIEYPKYPEKTYLDRVREWLGEGHWGIVLLNIKHFTNNAYIMPHVVSHSQKDLSEEFSSWMGSYEAADIDGMGWAMLYVKRLESGPDWLVEVEAERPLRPQEWVGEWLVDLAKAHAGDEMNQPILHPEAAFWNNPATGIWKAEWPDRCLKPVELSSLAGKALAGMLEARELSDEEQPGLSELARLGLVRSTA